MQLPIQAQPVVRNVSTAELTDNSGILPSKKCDWSCRVCKGSGIFKVCWNDPTCPPAKKLCGECMDLCSNLPSGSHARKVCEDKC